MSRRALITGITGQDGSYLAEHLLAQGYEVLAFLRPGTARRDGVPQLGSSAHLVDSITCREFPIDARDHWERWLGEEQPDEIYHLAGVSFVPDSWRDPRACHAVNCDWTALLLETMRICHPTAKFFYACSSEVFGTPDSWPQNEETPFQPRTPYGITKAAAAWLTRAYRERYSLFACSGILFNHESPRRDARFVTRKITRGAAAIAAGIEQKLKLGNLEIQRDWGFAGEYVDAMQRMLQQGSPDDYVIGTGVLSRLESVVEIAFAEVGLCWREFVESDPALHRPCEQRQVVADPSKALKKLGWKAEVSMASLIRMMVDSDVDALQGICHNRRA